MRTGVPNINQNSVPHSRRAWRKTYAAGKKATGRFQEDFTTGSNLSYTAPVKTISQDLLNEVTRRLAAEFQPEQVWLFGSHAWGQPDEGSDLDLLVVVRESEETAVRRAQRAHRCLSGLGIAKDIMVKTRQELERFRNVRSSLEAEILERGRLIYG